MLDRFSLFGYRLVTPPAFELASVIERGLGTDAASDVLRFIEPESGEVAVLRPDMTPQIARIVATRMREHAAPYRIAYEGTVVRPPAPVARRSTVRFPQVGVELCGVASEAADLELLELASDALRAAGLTRFTIDLSDAGIVRELLADVGAERAADITGALSTKDEAILAEHVRGLAMAAPLLALSRLHGGRDAIEEAVKVLATTRANAAAKRLLALFGRGLGGWARAVSHGRCGRGSRLRLLHGHDLLDLRGRVPVSRSAPADATTSCSRASARRCPRSASGSTSTRSPGRCAMRGVGQSAARRRRLRRELSDGRVAALRRRGIPAVAFAYHDAALAHARSWVTPWSGMARPSSTCGRRPRPASTQTSAGDADRDAGLVARVLDTLPRGA